MISVDWWFCNKEQGHVWFFFFKNILQETIREGDGENFPKKGNRLKMHYKWVVQTREPNTWFIVLGFWQASYLKTSFLTFLHLLSSSAEVLWHLMARNLTPATIGANRFPSKLERVKLSRVGRKVIILMNANRRVVCFLFLKHVPCFFFGRRYENEPRRKGQAER